MDMKLLFGADAISEEIGIPADVIRTMADAGEIPILRLGGELAIRRERLVEWLAALESSTALSVAAVDFRPAHAMFDDGAKVPSLAFRTKSKSLWTCRFAKLSIHKDDGYLGFILVDDEDNDTIFTMMKSFEEAVYEATSYYRRKNKHETVDVYKFRDGNEFCKESHKGGVYAYADGYRCGETEHEFMDRIDDFFSPSKVEDKKKSCPEGCYDFVYKYGRYYPVTMYPEVTEIISVKFPLFGANSFAYINECASCGIKYGTNLKLRKFCSDECKDGPCVQKTYKITCQTCSNKFETKFKQARYCGKECTSLANKERVAKKKSHVATVDSMMQIRHIA